MKNENKIKTRKMKGYQFMRQKPIGDYIVDFYCSKLKLVIEIDEESHIDKFNKDKIRQQKLESSGTSLLRFSDLYIKNNMDGVLKEIEIWIKEKQPP